jgi:CRP-like cAMP-binding protein
MPDGQDFDENQWNSSFDRISLELFLSYFGDGGEWLQKLRFHQRWCKAGDLLVCEGRSQERLFFLREGWACRVADTSRGKAKVCAILVAGDVCNLDALVSTNLVPGLRMLTAGVVISVPLAEVRALVLSSVEFACAVACMGFVNGSLAGRRANRLAHLQARDRLIDLLCELTYRAGHGHYGVEGRSFSIPISQTCIADLLGLTPVHLNRTIRDVRREELLTSQNPLVVGDIGALRRAVAFNPAYLHLDSQGHRRSPSVMTS